MALLRCSSLSWTVTAVESPEDVTVEPPGGQGPGTHGVDRAAYPACKSPKWKFPRMG